MAGTLQVGGVTLGTHNSGTGKVDLTNAGVTTITTLNTTSIASGTITSAVNFPTGQILQTVQYFQPAQFSQAINVASSTSGNYVVLNDGSNDFAVTIAPTKANSKILVQISFGHIVAHNVSSGHGLSARLLRDISGGTSNVSIAESTGTRTPRGAFNLSTSNHTYDGGGKYFQYLDSPSQSAGVALTYKVALMPHTTGTYTILCNYHASSSSSGNSGYQGNSASTFIAQEISP